MVLHPDYQPLEHTPVPLVDGNDRIYIDSRTGTIVQMAQIPTQKLADELKRREKYLPSLPSQFPPQEPTDWNKICRYIMVILIALGGSMFGMTLLTVSFILSYLLGLLVLAMFLMLVGTIGNEILKDRL